MEDKKINTNIDEVKVQNSDQVISAVDEETLEDVNGGAIVCASNRGSIDASGALVFKDGEERALRGGFIADVAKIVADSLDPEEKLLKYYQDKGIYKNDDKWIK